MTPSGPSRLAGTGRRSTAVRRPIHPVEAPRPPASLWFPVPSALATDRRDVSPSDRRTPQEQELRPVPREHRAEVERSCPPMAAIVVPVPGRPQRCRRRRSTTRAPLRAGPNGAGSGRCEPIPPRRAPRSAVRGRPGVRSADGLVGRSRAIRDEIHGEPPFEARPCRALALRPGPPQDGIEVLRHPVLGIRVEPVGDGRSKPSLGFMPGAPLGCRGRGERRRRAPHASA